VAAVWVVFEALRVRWPIGGFAWGQVGVALHDLPAARALASWGGVPLVTFAVVLVNGLLVQLGVAWRDHDSATRVLRPVVTLVGVGIVVALAAVFAFEPSTTGTLRFALLQGNDQDRRLTQAEIDGGFLTRKHLALADTLRGEDYDLIVFPESALETDPEADPQLKAQLVALARRRHSAILVNVIDEQTPGKRYNANRFYDPTGRLRGTYAKQHLVPFGEYVPWRDQLDFIGELQQVPVDFDAGDRTEVFRSRDRRLGTVICFESAFAPLMRASARAGAEAIIVATNNRSYHRSPNSAQHVALSQMSAATIGRPVLHAAISGITAVIDADGDIETTTGLFDSTVVSGRIATVRGETPAVRFGDWVEWVSVLVVLGAVVLAVVRPRLAVPESEAGGSDL
jgi:apolipoprotein N-acyltransferase